MRRPITAAALLIALTGVSSAQEQWDDWKWGVLAGGHYRDMPSIELGATYARGVGRDLPLGSYGVSISGEWIFGERVMVAPQVSGWISVMFLTVGANLIYVTDFQHDGVMIRLEAGVGNYSGRIVYGLTMGGSPDLKAVTIGTYDLALKIYLRELLGL